MKKVLIANRGEIAVRIIRSLKEMGIGTVAVFSEADRNAMHVRMADEAVCIGPAPSSESYLNGDKIIEVCKALKVNGIHPGYGFLSENPRFAEKVEKAGLVFIGPSPRSMKIMGNKLAAKKAISKYNIPLVPGTDEPVTTIGDARKAAEKIGFPVLIKASAGGGGKGMRVVKKAGELEEQMQLARSESQSSFGDSSVFLEKYIDSPRHIEIQILGDEHGNIIHLFERECSIQRRHQKVIEEAPSAIMTADLRERMSKCAVDVAKACRYKGAGTVEFLVDKNLDFYFLEMNTRLQVEHPVTEFITGLDLVKEQVRIAMGQKLSLKQDEVKINGHSIELRVYAEDSSDNFFPDIGRLQTYVRPQGKGVRVDDGFEEGMDIPIYYDPMIAKLITHAETRKEAIKKMIRAIDEYKISGVKTTLSFGKFVMQHRDFISGKFDTHFVENSFDPQKLTGENKKEAAIAAALAAKLLMENKLKPADNHSDGMAESGAKWRARKYEE